MNQNTSVSGPANQRAPGGRAPQQVSQGGSTLNSAAAPIQNAAPILAP